jgi:hypothetical protein
MACSIDPLLKPLWVLDDCGSADEKHQDGNDVSLQCQVTVRAHGTFFARVRARHHRLSIFRATLRVQLGHFGTLFAVVHESAFGT